MRAVLSDGTEIECGNFKALDSGVVLTGDRKRKKVIGFVPMARLRYVVPDDFEAAPGGDVRDAEDAADPDEYVELRGRDSGDEETATDSDAADAAEPTAPDEGEQRDAAVVRFADPTAPSTADTAAAATEERRPTTEDDYVELAFDEGADADGSALDAEETDLRSLGSLGRASAERLSAAGFATLADLAVADPDTVASSADVPPGRARRWVKAARSRVESDGTAPDEAATAEVDEAEVDGDEEVDETADGDEEVDETADGDEEVDETADENEEADETADGDEAGDDGPGVGDEAEEPGAEAESAAGGEDEGTGTTDESDA